MEILLIEDNAGDALLIRTMLGDIDAAHVIRWTDRLSKGLQELAASPPDLVLLDLELPDSSGLETVDEARAATHRIPIIVLTGHQDHELAAEAMRRGVQDYLAKGRFDADLLERSIRYAIGRKQAELGRLDVEQQLYQAQRLQSIGQLAAGIAHEINTPTQYVRDNLIFLRQSLAAVTGMAQTYLELVSACERGQPPAELVARARTVCDAVDLDYVAAEIPAAIEQSVSGIQRVSAIMAAMKELSHPAQGASGVCDLNRLIESTLIVARSEWKRVAEVELCLDRDLTNVCCHAGEIGQVVLNLVVNAAHAIADASAAKGKGRITITTRREGEQAAILVSDTGTGIPEAARARVFDPFFTTKDVGRGTGQGLALAHAIVVGKHEGSIRFETEIGKGTTFEVRIPMDGPAREPQAARPGGRGALVA
jgi:signal transduction histidine kinase